MKALQALRNLILTSADREPGVPFGDYLKGQKVVISRLTSQNQLFLSKAARNNMPQLEDVYYFFAKDFMAIPFLDTWVDSLYVDKIAQELLKTPDNELHIHNFKRLIQSFDTGIFDFKIKENDKQYSLEKYKIGLNLITSMSNMPQKKRYKPGRS